jgi:dihydroneopterin aldolase / 2-amino-4-hydroxy-6-hydroxymethyldihydropteridine diphosphokinase
MRVYIALGSNLGNREEYLRSGLRGLVDRHVKISRTASLYSTAPRDLIEQPWFLNTAIEADTQLYPEGLLAACLEVEKDNDRIRDSRTSKGPRTLDIDIIFYGNYQNTGSDDTASTLRHEAVCSDTARRNRSDFH